MLKRKVLEAEFAKLEVEYQAHWSEHEKHQGAYVRKRDVIEQQKELYPEERLSLSELQAAIENADKEVEEHA